MTRPEFPGPVWPITAAPCLSSEHPHHPCRWATADTCPQIERPHVVEAGPAAPHTACVSKKSISSAQPCKRLPLWSVTGLVLGGMTTH
eukprot:scaffold122364_cov19-Tisochrysis_lutea.AAC.1